MKRAIVAATLVVSGCGGAHAAAPPPQPPGRADALKACTDWSKVSMHASEKIDTAALDRAVNEAKAAAQASGKYLRLWKVMWNYQLQTSSGFIVPETYPTEGVDEECANV